MARETDRLAAAGDSPAGAGKPESPPGEYVVVARRYRPQLFDELIGQEQVSRALTGAIAANRVGHAYLFTGARGVGKTSAARILAKALDCQSGPTATPCNECDICLSINRGSDVDVIEIDGASNRGIDEIRQLRQNVNVRPSRARFKIYIIDEVHMLTKEAFNALLKTLEEPPEHVKFIFCTTEAGKIPITILSRCQRFDFAGIRTASIQNRLSQIVASEGVEAEPEALALLARRANGSMRDSQSLLEQLLSFGQHRITAADVHALLGSAADTRLAALVGHLSSRGAAGALAELDGALAEGVDVGQLLEQLLGYFRDAMAAVVGCPADTLLYTSPSQHQQVLDLGRQLGLETILAIVQILDQTLARLRYSPQGRTLAEIALVRVANLENLEAVAAIIAQLRDDAGSLPAIAAVRPAPAIAPPLAAKKKAELPAAAMHSSSGELPPNDALAELSAEDESSSDVPRDYEQRAENGAKKSPAIALTQLSSADLERLWKQAIGDLSGLLADFAAQTASLAISAPNRLVATFPAKYNSGKLFCEKPQNLAELERVLAATAGQPVRLELVVAAAESQPQAERRASSPRQKLAEKAETPFVRRAGELFGAGQMRLEEPDGGG